MSDSSSTTTVDPGTMSRNQEHTFVPNPYHALLHDTYGSRINTIVQPIRTVPSLLWNTEKMWRLHEIKRTYYGDSLSRIWNLHSYEYGLPINWMGVSYPYPVDKNCEDFHVNDRLYVWEQEDGEWECTECVPGSISLELLEKCHYQSTNHILEFVPYLCDVEDYNRGFYQWTLTQLVYERDGEFVDVVKKFVDSDFGRFDDSNGDEFEPHSEKEHRRELYSKKRTHRDEVRDARYWRMKAEALERKLRAKGRKDKDVDRRPESNGDLLGRSKRGPIEVLFNAASCVFAVLYRICVMMGPIGCGWMAFHYSRNHDEIAIDNYRLALLEREAREERIREEERCNQFLIQSRITQGDGIDATALFSSFAGALTILSTASNWSQVGVQLAGIAMLKFNKNHTKFLEDLFKNYVREGVTEFFAEDASFSGSLNTSMQPEGPFEPMLMRLRELRSNTASLQESPIGKALMACMTLFAYTFYGTEDGKVDVSDDSVKALFRYADLKLDDKGKDLTSSFFDLAEFSLSFADLIKSNPSGLGHFIFPKTIASRFAYIKEHIPEFENGNLSHRLKINPDDFFNDAVALEVDLRLMLAKMNRRNLIVSPALQSLYTQYHNQIELFLVRMKKSKVFHSFRRRCLAVVLTGESGVGKSSLSKQIIHTLGDACGFKHSSGDIWNASDGKFDDGLIAGATVYDFDDVGNGVLGNQDASEALMARLVKFINNVVSISRQADVGDKGAIAYEPELVVITSNIPNLNGPLYTNDLLSFYSRLSMFSVKVKPEYAKPDGTIDQSKASLLSPVHLLQEYKCTPTAVVAPRGKSTAAMDRKSASSRKGINIEDIGVEMPVEEFMQMLVQRFEDNRSKQERLVSDYNVLSHARTCSNCNILKSWCSCLKYDSDDDTREPEAFLDALTGIPGALMTDIVSRLSTIRFPRLRSKIGSCIANAFVGVIGAACRGFYAASFTSKIGVTLTAGALIGASAYPSYYLYQFSPNLALFCGSMALTSGLLVLGHVKDLAARATVVMMEDYIKKGVTPLTVSIRVLAMGIALRAAASTITNLMSPTSIIEPQGSLMPVSKQEAKDKLEVPDFWSLPVTPPVAKDTYTQEQAWNAISKYIVQIDDKSLAYCITGDLFVIPKHIRTDSNVRVKVSKLPPTLTNSCYGNLYDRFDMPDKDFAFLRFTNSVNLVSGMKYLPNSDCDFPAVGTVSLFRKMWQHFPTRLIPGFISNGTKDANGNKFVDYGCRHFVETIRGDCMSPILPASGPFAKIVGFHMGGSKIPGVVNGCAYRLTKEDVRNAVSVMNLVVPEGFYYDTTCMPEAEWKNTSLEVHSRAVSNFIPAGTENVARVEVLGAVKAASLKPKSQLVPSCIASHIVGYPNKFGPPVFRKNRNYAEYFQKSLQGLQPIDHRAVCYAVNDYCKGLISVVALFPWQGPAVISFDQAVNGIDGNRFVSSINLQTAGGPGYLKKNKHFELVGDVKVASADVKNATLHLLDQLRAGIVGIPRISTGLKDEATLTFEFAGKNKVRIFFVAPTHFLLVGKMLFAKIHSFLMTFPQCSELMGSLNHCTEEWSELVEYATRYEHLFDGDYSKYDTRQTKQTFDAAKEVFVWCAHQLNYESQDIVAICAYMDAMCFASLEYNGVLLQYAMWMKSGVWVTLLLNGVTNALLMRIVYYNLGFNAYFRSSVALAIQGDDVCGSTSLPGFNMIAMAAAFNEIGMPFTSASKTDQTKEFVELHEMTFCNRSFVYNEALAVWEAPLALDSIWKSLFWHNSAGALSSLETIVGDAWTKILEWSRHGEEVFNEETSRFFVALSRIGVSPSSLGCPSLTYEGVMKWRVEHHYTRQSEGYNLCESVHQETYIPPNDNRALDFGYHMCHSGVALKACLVTVIHNRAIENSSLLIRKKVKFRMTENKNNNLDFSRMTHPEPEDRAVHNVVYNDETLGWSSGGCAMWEPSQDVSRDNHTNDSIVERPVQIAQYEWTPGVPLNVRFDPWSQVCEDPAVVNRLALHFLGKFDLELTFFLNGGPFYYGRLFAAYNPLPQGNSYTLANTITSASLMQLSQLSHIQLDPRNSEGGTLECPFIWRNHSVEIPVSEWDQLGQLIIQEVNPLSHANGSTDPVTLTIFGRIKNVHLSVPTANLPDSIEPQGKDEYGLVSAPLDRLARVAGTMEEVPVLGTYAKATQMIARVGADVAKMFGFSSPRQLGSNNPVQQPNLAVVDEEFRGSSLALFGKRETTIDPAVVGAPPVDELAISSLARRWSYLTQFNWSTSDGAGNGLFYIDVWPLLNSFSTTEGGENRMQLTPMGFATLPFGAWSGQMEFKFQVVCSAHHRGRLRFTHDPMMVLPGIGNITNRNEIGVVDITATTEYVMKVDWSQAKNYLRLDRGSLEVLSPGFSTMPRSRNEGANGQIGVTVFNGLTSPADGDQEIQINVFVRGGEHYFVHDPIAQNLFGLTYVTDTLATPEDPPTQSPDDDATSPQDPEPMLITYMGDPRGYMDDFAQDGLDAVSNIGVNSTDTLVLKTGNRAAAVRAYALAGQTPTFDLRLRATATGVSTLTWDDVALGNGNTVTFNGIGDTQTITVTLNSGARDGVVFWNFNLTSGARMAVESITTTVPDSIQLNILTPTMLASQYAGTISNGEFTFSSDTTLSLADVLIDGSVNRETLSTGDYQTITGTNGVNEPWFIPSGTTVSAIYYFSGSFVPQGEDIHEKEGDEGNPEADHIDTAVHSVTTHVSAVDVFWGEPVTSFRPILKRFETYYRVLAIEEGGLRVGLPHFPTIDLTSTLTEGTLITRDSDNFSLFRYVRACFATERGSMRIKFLYNGAASGRLVHTVLRRGVFNSPLAPVFQTHSGISGFLFGGTGYSFSPLTGEASFEVPWYSTSRFFPARSEAQFLTGYDKPTYVATVQLSTDGGVEICYATGEDYQLSVFTHVPSLEFS